MRLHSVEERECEFTNAPKAGTLNHFESKVLKIVLPKAKKLWKKSSDCANLLVLIHRQFPRTQFREQMVTFYNRKFKIPDGSLQTHLLRVLMWTSLK